MSTTIDATGRSDANVAEAPGLWGHPRGLSTLFFTEMWERFSYYGMRAILLLYMTKSLADGGLGFDTKYAGLIYGTYTSSVYWTPLIGGWLADRVFGARRAVLIGGIIIACGHFSMVFRNMVGFYGGLALIAIGVGLLKPNVSAMVGDLYTEGDKRRDAGFSIFYMGINLGAFIAPLVCGYLGQKVDWHYGFAAAGIGMVLGLVQYVLSGDRLKNVGLKPVRKEDDIAKTADVDYVTIVLAVVGCVAGLSLGFYVGGVGIVSALFPGVVGFFVGYLAGTFRHLQKDEAARVGVIFILFVFSSLFWMSFEQAGSSLTLFADRLTRTEILGFSFPSSWYQSVQPAFVILLAPVFALIWVKLGKREPSSPAKFAFGLLLTSISFAIVAFASTLIPAGEAAALTPALKAGPMWLVVVYLFSTLGELCLSPVGLSTVSKLSPARMVGLMMGVWFLSISVGNFVAGWAAGFFNENSEGALLTLFGSIAAITFVAAIVLAAITPLIKKMTPKSA